MLEPSVADPFGYVPIGDRSFLFPKSLIVDALRFVPKIATGVNRTAAIRQRLAVDAMRGMITVEDDTLFLTPF